MARTPCLSSTGSNEAGANRTGFFDLPREIRDSIYIYALAAIFSGVDNKTGTLRRQHPQRRPPDFWLRRIHPPFSGPEWIPFSPDRWLATPSTVSRQFRSEIRTTLFKSYTFLIQENDNNRAFGPPWTERLPSFSFFIHRLGEEAKALRRLEVWCRTPVQPDTPDVEEALNEFKNHLHTDVRILVCAWKDGFWLVGQPVFGCRTSSNGSSGFHAKKLRHELDVKQWERD